MRKFALASVLTLRLAMSASTSGGYSSGSASSPTAPTPMTANGVITVDVVAINGAQSFSPNPATLPVGQMVAWYNVNNTTHRIVLNDRTVDTGNLAPGASSQPTGETSVKPVRSHHAGARTCSDPRDLTPL